MYNNVKMKIALFREKVRIVIKILVGDHWTFIFRGGKKITIGHTILTKLDRSCFYLFKAVIPGSVSEY